MSLCASPAPFYQTALIALAALEHHEPTKRRFGPDADSAWDMFRGHLDVADRIDLLIRDAAVRNPAAFSPRLVFGFEDLPEDEPFGPSWQSPYGPDTGKRAWQETLALRGETPGQLWQRVLSGWEVSPDAPSPDLRLDTASRILVVGTGAVTALAPRFLEDRNLDWGRQVVTVAEAPAALQLAGLVPILAGTKSAARVARLADPLPDPGEVLTGLQMKTPDHVVRSASPTSLEAEFLAGTPGID